MILHGISLQTFAFDKPAHSVDEHLFFFQKLISRSAGDRIRRAWRCLRTVGSQSPVDFGLIGSSVARKHKLSQTCTQDLEKEVAFAHVQCSKLLGEHATDKEPGISYSDTKDGLKSGIHAVDFSPEEIQDSIIQNIQRLSWIKTEGERLYYGTASTSLDAINHTTFQVSQSKAELAKCMQDLLMTVQKRVSAPLKPQGKRHPALTSRFQAHHRQEQKNRGVADLSAEQDGTVCRETETSSQ